jgi:hypothetical protein
VITLTEAVTKVEVSRTIFVSKNGSDITGLPERLDKPFKSIQGATASAIATFPTRDADNRVLIVVETGYYIDQISVEDFIDYDLGNSVIESPSAVPTIFASDLTTYTATTGGVPNCIIYGNAIVRTNNIIPNTAVVEIKGQCKVLLYCNIIRGELYEAILMRSGELIVYANIIHNALQFDAVRQVINLATSNGFPSAPILEVNGAKIYNNPINATNSVIEIYNGIFGTTLTLNRCKLTLNNCQVGNYSTNRSAIDTPRAGADRGYGDITCNNTIVWCQDLTKFCFSDNFTLGNFGDLNVYLNGLYSNVNFSLTNPASNWYANNFILNANVQFNNGVTI